MLFHTNEEADHAGEIPLKYLEQNEYSKGRLVQARAEATPELCEVIYSNRAFVMLLMWSFWFIDWTCASQLQLVSLPSRHVANFQMDTPVSYEHTEFLFLLLLRPNSHHMISIHVLIYLCA